MRIADDKIESVRSWPTPTSTRHIRQFLGLTNYFLDYMERYAELAAPLSALQGVKANFVWTDKEQAAFDRLKSAVITAPALATFDPEFPHLRLL